jgi:hypothetical protein
MLQLGDMIATINGLHGLGASVADQRRAAMEAAALIGEREVLPNTPDRMAEMALDLARRIGGCPMTGSEAHAIVRAVTPSSMVNFADWQKVATLVIDRCLAAPSAFDRLTGRAAAGASAGESALTRITETATAPLVAASSFPGASLLTPLNLAIAAGIALAVVYVRRR